MELKRPRLLVLTPRYPYPVIGGDRLRIYYLCKELAKDYSLTLLSLCESSAELNSEIPRDGVFERVERVFLPKWRSLFNVILAMPTDTPMQVAYYRSSEFARRLEALLPQHDVCLAHLIRTGDYVDGVVTPKVLEMTDAISLNYKRVRQLKARTSLKTWVYSLEADRLLKYEKDAIRRFDVVSLVSDTDRTFLLDGGQADHVLTCSNGVDLSTLPYHERPESGRVIAFIGNVTSAQNFDACVHFAEDLLPALRAKYGVSFRVVGKIYEAQAEDLRKYDGVEVTGLVESVADAVKDAVIGVCPVRLGAGVQNKVLEYMALGIPTITSTIGLEGLAAQPEKDLLVADTVDEYLQAVGRLLNDRGFALGLAREGRRYVEQHHDWGVMIRPLRERIAKVLEGRVG